MIGLDPRIRRLEPGDAARLQRMFRRLSRETVIRRFFTFMPTLKEPALQALTSVDHDTHEALAVVVGDEIVALASYHRSPSDPALADVAVLVEDGWQHHGLGRVLVRRLAQQAAERGITTFHADVMAGNRAATGLIRRMDRTTRARWNGDVLSYDLPLRAA